MTFGKHLSHLGLIVYLGFGLMSSAVVHGNQSHCELIITSTDVGAHHGVWLPAFSIPQLGLLEK